jgi:ABC-type transporter lipoprotein component MlaA
VVLPILGPSNPRDALGIAADSYADPFKILATAHGVNRFGHVRRVGRLLKRKQFSASVHVSAVFSTQLDKLFL